MRLIPAYAVADFTDAVEVEREGGDLIIGYATKYVYSIDNTLLRVYFHNVKYLAVYCCWVGWSGRSHVDWGPVDAIDIALRAKAPVFIRSGSWSGSYPYLNKIIVYWQCSMTGPEKPAQQLISIGVFDIDRYEYAPLLRILPKYNIQMISYARQSDWSDWLIRTLQDKMSGRNYVIEYTTNSQVSGVSNIATCLEPV